jgi:hypothetical protein
VDYNDLNGPQLKILRMAFQASFNRQSLDRLLVEHLDKPPLEMLVPSGDFESEVFQLIRRTKQEGWTEELVTAATSASGNAKMKNLANALSLVEVDGDTRLVQRSLERTVREKSGFADFLPWAEKLIRLGHKMCRIEDASTARKALGTGFLVAPDLVLTNYHVVEGHIASNAKADPTQLGCRFDYAVGPVGENPGLLKPLAASWLVAHRQYSAVDSGDQGGLPKETELDYALLRLADPIGEAPSPDGDGKRGWIPVSTGVALPEPNDILFIVQHPKGSPLKLAVGRILLRNGNQTRIRYDANTEPGSSGSAGFDAKLGLVLLHHGGDPDTGRLAQFNQGIPIDRIVADLGQQADVPRFWQ